MLNVDSSGQGIITKGGLGKAEEEVRDIVQGTNSLDMAKKSTTSIIDAVHSLRIDRDN